MEFKPTCGRTSDCSIIGMWSQIVCRLQYRRDLHLELATNSVYERHRHSTNYALLGITGERSNFTAKFRSKRHKLGRCRCCADCNQRNKPGCVAVNRQKPVLPIEASLIRSKPHWRNFWQVVERSGCVQKPSLPLVRSSGMKLQNCSKTIILWGHQLP